jgi:alkanesulfonate monooxygenase SsuD/methylene tetrahydromethanopterin reductase-like flavin-dependent oxidoreductase (luciferase family)
MILDIFSELQRSGPRRGDDHEGSVYRDAIAQAKLADELGFGCWWQVEHHGAPDFSYSSAPDMFLAILSQHTERIHLGHSGVLAPYAINNPLRVAERAAFLDVMSGGRLELGLARSVPTEWDTFGVDPDITKAQVNEALYMLPKMWSEGTFEWNSETFSMPERDVTPKPVQRPHPPLWVTSGSPEGFEACGRMGVGVLGTVMLSPMEHLEILCRAYAKGLAQCEPVSQVVNGQVAAFAFMHCAETEQEVIDSRAAEAAIWFMNAQAEVFGVVREVWLTTLRDKLPLWNSEGANVLDPRIRQEIGDLDDPEPLIRLMNRQLAGMEIDPVEAYEVLAPLDAVLIGDVDTCRRKLRAYEATGVDRVMCLMQVGDLSQDLVMRSLRTTGKFLIPEVASA